MTYRDDGSALSDGRERKLAKPQELSADEMRDLGPDEPKHIPEPVRDEWEHSEHVLWEKMTVAQSRTSGHGTEPKSENTGKVSSSADPTFTPIEYFVCIVVYLLIGWAIVSYFDWSGLFLALVTLMVVAVLFALRWFLFCLLWAGLIVASIVAQVGWDWFFVLTLTLLIVFLGVRAGVRRFYERGY
jgi:hypothetical protein